MIRHRCSRIHVVFGSAARRDALRPRSSLPARHHPNARSAPGRQHRVAAVDRADAAEKTTAANRPEAT